MRKIVASPYGYDRNRRNLRESPGSVVTTIVVLVCVGARAGAVASFLILGLDAFLSQLGNPTSERFSQLIVSIFRRMSNVLVVWFQAPVDGAIMGATTGLTVSIAYLATIWIERGGTLLSQSKWFLPIILAVAGAVGAAMGSRGFLADLRIWTTLVGALYGLVAAFIIAQARTDRLSS